MTFFHPLSLILLARRLVSWKKIKLKKTLSENSRLVHHPVGKSLNQFCTSIKFTRLNSINIPTMSPSALNLRVCDESLFFHSILIVNCSIFGILFTHCYLVSLIGNPTTPFTPKIPSNITSKLCQRWPEHPITRPDLHLASWRIERPC